MNTTDDRAEEVKRRLTQRVTRAVKLSLDTTLNPTKRAIAQAYLTLHKRYPLFLRATVKHPHFKDLCERPDFNLLEHLVRLPARWEFEHIFVFGEVSDAMTTAGRYAASKKFVAVHPVDPGDPWTAFSLADKSTWRIPYIHKATSPFRISYERKNELRAQLGSGYRSLVNHAKGMTKKWWLEQFYTPAIPNAEQVRYDYPGGMVGYSPKPGETRPNRLIPVITELQLLSRTGYTPAEFWREIHNPRTVKPLPIFKREPNQPELI